ncbi:MAG TPA: hypothetical protein VK203_27505 [Nostocaceae cyanobacterium]|nr:hypothetical protein [Nostocaceae cyanobacterium]
MTTLYALPQGVIENINALENSGLWELIQLTAFAAQDDPFDSGEQLHAAFDPSNSISDDTFQFVAEADQAARGFLIEVIANLIGRRNDLRGLGSVSFNGKDLVEATYSTSPITAETNEEVTDGGEDLQVNIIRGFTHILPLKDETSRDEITRTLQAIERVDAEEAEVQDREDPYGDDDVEDNQ